MNKLLVICGPTATGKTALGVRLAQKFQGEIVSADSRQVYRGMDIITGKDLPLNSELRTKNLELNIENNKFTVGYRLKEDIPVWLVDIVDVEYTFNVGEYKILAQKVISDIRKRGKLPIVVGGTGFYISALTRDMDLILIPPNKPLRKELEGKSVDELVERLVQLNPGKLESMNESDRANPRRLIRAIEVSFFMKKRDFNNRMYERTSRQDVLMIGLTTPTKQKLYDIIDKRVEERIKMGAVKEAEIFFKRQYLSSLPALSATGYRPLLRYLQRTLKLDEAIQNWKFIEHAYARRQWMWFKKDRRIDWYNIMNRDYIEKIEGKLGKWYTVNKS